MRSVSTGNTNNFILSNIKLNVQALVEVMLATGKKAIELARI